MNYYYSNYYGGLGYGLGGFGGLSCGYGSICAISKAMVVMAVVTFVPLSIRHTGLLDFSNTFYYPLITF